MARTLERVEFLFRRQVALETANLSLRETVRRLDPVPARTRNGLQASRPAVSDPQDRRRPTAPDRALVPSAGHFNAARVPSNAPVWLFLIGTVSQKKLKTLISTICGAQSSSRGFRPVFILNGSEHIELMRQYGFTFQVISAEDYIGMSRSEQIEIFRKKWGAQLCMDLQAARLAGACRPAHGKPGVSPAEREKGPSGASPEKSDEGASPSGSRAVRKQRLLVASNAASDPKGPGRAASRSKTLRGSRR